MRYMNICKSEYQNYHKQKSDRRDFPAYFFVLAAVKKLTGTLARCVKILTGRQETDTPLCQIFDRRRSAPCFTKTITYLLTIAETCFILVNILKHKEDNVRYRMTMGEPLEFTADTDAEFLGTLRGKHMYAKPDDEGFLRQLAASACEWTGESIDFSSISAYKSSLMRAGVLEVVDASV